MYAVIEAGSKQFTVKEKDLIKVEKLDHKPGKEFHLGKILLVKDGKTIHVGQPYLKEFKVEAKVLKDVKADKVISYGYRRRKNSERKIGHRQKLSLVEILKISSEKSGKAEKKEESSKEKGSKK